MKRALLAAGISVAAVCCILVGILAVAGVVPGGGGGESSRPSPLTPGTSSPPAMDSDPAATLPPAQWEEVDAQQAADAAGHAVAAYTAKDRTPTDWWNALASVLTPAAQVAYADTDPANVPGTTVTGQPVATPGASFYVATAVVPTDAGRWIVLLSRADTGPGNPWRVEQMTPPDGAH